MSASLLTEDDLHCIAQAAPQWCGGNVAVVQTPHAGRVVVKSVRAARHPARYHALNALTWLLGVPYLKTAPLPGGVLGQMQEVRRLRALRAAGVRVPQVLHVADDHFVMQWLGPLDLASALRMHGPQAAALWRAGGDALVRIHAAGQCLSQAFARNLIVSEDGVLAGAIDFEDDPLQVMSLPDAQERNWLDYLFSTLWLSPVPLAQADACLHAWMQAESAAVRSRFVHACRRLAWLRVLPKQRKWGRDVVSLQAAAAAAHCYLQWHESGSPLSH